MKTIQAEPDLRKNLTYSLLYQILILILPLVTLPYIARIFGSGNIGIYAYTYTAAHYFFLLAMLGINNHGTRSIAAVRDDPIALRRTFLELFILKAVSASVVFALYMLCSYFWFSRYRSIFLLQSLYVLSAAFNVNWFCFGLEKFRLTVLRDTLVQILSTAAVFLFVRTGADLRIYTLILAGAQLCSALAVWPFVLRTLKRAGTAVPSTVTAVPGHGAARAETFPAGIDVQGILRHVRPLFVLFIPVLAESLYLLMDKVMLGSMTSPAETGFYECAVRVIAVPGVIIGAMNNTIMPRTSRLVSEGRAKEAKLLQDRTMLAGMFAGFALTFGLAATGRDFAILFYGGGYERTGLFLLLLSPAVLFRCLSLTVRMQYIIPSGQDRLYVVSVVFGAAINLLLNLVLIPRMYGTGAVIGTLAAEGTVMILQFVFCRKMLRLSTLLPDCLAFACIGAAMYLTVRMIPVLLKTAARMPAGSAVSRVMAAFSLSPKSCQAAVLLLQILAGACVCLLLSSFYIKKRYRP